MADFNGATQIDLTPQALAMIRLIQAGQGTNSDSRFTGRFGPGFPPMPVEPETEPRLFQYQPGTNLMMIPRMGYNSLPFATLRAMAGACKEIRINIEHIKRIMRGVDWDIIPNDKKKTVVGGKTYVATPETESVKKFFQRPDGINPFDAWLNMVLEEVLVTDALTFWPVQERGRELQAVEVIDGTTIKPLLDMRGATPRPPMPAYLQIIWGTPQSSYPANTLIYRPLNTKVNSPYGESPIEWVLTAINTAIRKDLSAVGYYADGNIPGAFYTVPESWTPEQIQTFQSYIDALMAGDLSRFAKLLAVPGGTGSHVTTFQNNDPDNPALNEYLMKVACWAYGNNPAEFGITGGAGLGGAGFMEGSENIQQRSLIGPVSNFLAGIFTEIIHDWMRRPDLRFSWTGLEPVEDRATQATADQANIGLGVYNVAYVQDREGIPQEYRPTSAPSADPKVGSGTLPMPLPPGYEQYLKRAIDADLKQWETKALRSLKKGWGAASFTSEVIPEGVHASISEKLEKATTEADVKAAFVVDLELHKRYGPGTHKSASSPPDLYKRDETERVMADEMTEYFTGLADRITSAVRDADGAVSRIVNIGDVEGKEESGHFFKREFETDEERKAAFANMRANGTYDPSYRSKDGPDKKGKDITKEFSPAGNKISSAFTSITGPHVAEVKKVIEEIDKIHGMKDGLPQITIDGKAGRNYGVYSYDESRIGIAKNSEHPMNTTAHEIGHYVDNRAFGNGGYTFGSKENPEVQPLMSAISSSETMKNLRSGKYDYYTPEGESYRVKIVSPSQRKYYQSRVEMFARAYAQYVTVKSNNPQMMSELRNEQKSRYSHFTVWQDEEFKPIEAEFDKLFKSKGWSK